MSVYTSSREMLLKTALTAKKPLIEMAEKLIELGFDVNYPFDIDRTYYDVIVELKNKGIWNKPLPAKKEHNQQDKNTANLLNKPQVVNGIRQVKSITEYKDYIDKKMLKKKEQKNMDIQALLSRLINTTLKTQKYFLILKYQEKQLYLPLMSAME